MISSTLAKGLKHREVPAFMHNFDLMIPEDSMEPVFAVAVKNKTPILDIERSW